MCRILIAFLYMYCHWRSNYQEVRVVVPLAALTEPHCYARPKPEPGFLTSYVMVFFLIFIELGYEAIVRFVDNERIVDHHILKFLFLMEKLTLIRHMYGYKKPFILHYGLDFSAIRLGPYGGSHLLMLSF